MESEMDMKIERFNEEWLARQLGGRALAVRVLEQVDSTNSEAKRYALSGGEAPCAFLAETQTAGRGRMGRSFFSPDGTGIYLSLLLPPKETLADAVLLTSAAAVGACRAIRRVTGLSPAIKWVNDLYLNGRKVCGILAESFFVGDCHRTVLGIGVNLYTEDFPAELREIAGGLLPREGLRNALAAALIEEVMALWDNLSPDAFLEEYRRDSMVLGQSVTYTENGVCYTGVAESIDERGHLAVRRDDGSVAVLASGEISLRLKTNE